MASNDFLPFATGSTANVLSQPAYAALPAVATGYQSGVAQSAALNKTWRQSSIMSAVLAQFIADRSGSNAVDDGTTATLLANLKQAVTAGYNGFVSHSTATTLTASDIGPLVGAPAVTITLMALSTLIVGQSVTIIGTSSTGNPTPVVTSGSDNIVMGSVTTSTFSIPAGQSVKFTKEASTQWFAEGVAVAANIPLVIAPATASQHAVQLGQATGRLIGVQVFPSSGTYTPTAGMTFVIVKIQGGGAAGAGITVPSSGNASLGSPGGSGAYGEGKFLASAIGASQPVTIGAGGTAAAGAAGGNGGTSSVGSLISAPGGIGGSMLNNTVPPNVNSNGSPSSSPVGANIFSCVGGSQGYSLAQSATFMYGGAGSSGLSGIATGIVPVNTGGTSASNLGCGGSGTAGGAGSGVLAGGNGAKGYIEIWEYS